MLNDEIAKAQDWLIRLFGALSKLPDPEWAAKAGRERDRLAGLVERNRERVAA